MLMLAYEFKATLTIFRVTLKIFLGRCEQTLIRAYFIFTIQDTLNIFLIVVYLGFGFALDLDFPLQKGQREDLGLIEI